MVRVRDHPLRSMLVTAVMAAALLAVLGTDAATCLGGAAGAAIGLRLFAWSHGWTDAPHQAKDVSPQTSRRRLVVLASLALLALPLAIAGILPAEQAGGAAALLLALAALASS